MRVVPQYSNRSDVPFYSFSFGFVWDAIEAFLFSYRAVPSMAIFQKKKRNAALYYNNMILYSNGFIYLNDNNTNMSWFFSNFVHHYFQILGWFFSLTTPMFRFIKGSFFSFSWVGKLSDIVALWKTVSSYWTPYLFYLVIPLRPFFYSPRYPPLFNYCGRWTWTTIFRAWA